MWQGWLGCVSPQNKPIGVAEYGLNYTCNGCANAVTTSQAFAADNAYLESNPDGGVDGTFVCTPSRDQRRRSFSTALLHGCGPPPARSRGPSLAVVWDLLEASITVTECDWTRSYGRA